MDKYGRPGGEKGTLPIFTAAVLLFLLRSASHLVATKTHMSSSAMKKTTGKKRSANSAATGPSTAGGLKKIRGDWQRSSVTERQLEALRCDGVLPPLEKMATRVPGDEVAPHPRDGERACFVDFVNRGFAFPVHEFVSG